jgi:hypothetical protein
MVRACNFNEIFCYKRRLWSFFEIEPMVRGYYNLVTGISAKILGPP